MSVVVNRLTNGNVYLNGKNYFGAIEQATLPEVKMVMSEHKGLGMIGKLEFPAGIDKLNCKVKLNSFNEDIALEAGNPYAAQILMFRSSLEKYDAGGGRVGELPLVAIIRGTFTKFPSIDSKPQDNADTDVEMNVTAYELTINGEEIWNIDVVAQIHRVGGVDLLRQYRANLGI